MSRVFHRLIRLIAAGLLLSGLYCVCSVRARRSEETLANYAIVVDAGSTGTRAFVFQESVIESGERRIVSISCGKERLGLSSFAQNHSAAALLFTNLLENAAAVIPQQYHEYTSLYVRGTAGMRLLGSAEQETLWDATVQQLKNTARFPFKIDRKNFGTISGHQEAFYAVLASNYIAGSIDGDRRMVPGATLIGALDMGGSSNQLVIYNGSDPRAKVDSNHFWSHSWLRYGVETIRERVLRYLYERHIGSSAADATDEKGDGESGVTNRADGVVVLQNPCAFATYMDPYVDGYVFEGTGRPAECLHLIERIVWADRAAAGGAADGALVLDEVTADGIVETETVAPTVPAAAADSICARGPCAIEDIEHPSVRGHEFYAMSVYFYALDCVRELGPEALPHWPNPSIAEMKTAAESFCAMSWAEVEGQYRAKGGHTWTYPSQLPNRCLEALYIATLLEKGFGFDPHDRSITLALEVKGHEVEWTLGYALAEVDFAAHTKDMHERNDHDLDLLPPEEALLEAAERSRRQLLAYVEIANRGFVLLEESVKYAMGELKTLKAKYEPWVKLVKQYQWW